MTTERPTPKDRPCAACHGRGWILAFHTEREVYEIERCDTCGRFDSDKEAGDAAAPLIEAALAIADLAIQQAVDTMRRRRKP